MIERINYGFGHRVFRFPSWSPVYLQVGYWRHREHGLVLRIGGPIALGFGVSLGTPLGEVELYLMWSRYESEGTKDLRRRAEQKNVAD